MSSKTRSASIRTVAGMNEPTITKNTTSQTFAQQNRADEPPSTAFVTEYASVGNTVMPLSRPLPKRLLGVWAHPDDEAYLSAGLMARVISAGGHVTVVTATRGEKGTDDPSKYDSDDFGAFRERELRSSLAGYGVHDVRFLDLRDGECDFADDGQAVRAIVDVIAEVQPDTIVTFGPDGMTNHDDHKAVSRWTTEAWRRTGTTDLFYAAVTNDFLAAFADVHERLGVFGDFATGRPPSLSRRSVALECALNEGELAGKRRALSAHASQTTQLAEMMGEETYTAWWAEETFRRPTWSESHECPVPTWMHVATTERELVGAS